MCSYLQKLSLVASLTLLLFSSCEKKAETLDSSFLLPGVERVQLPNGWAISPVGKSIELGDLPMNMAISPDKKYLAVVNNGQSIQSVQVIDLQTEQLVATHLLKRSWFGLVFGADSKTLYVSGGNENCVWKFELQDTALVQVDSLSLGAPWPNKISITGIAVDEAKNLLFAVTKEDSALYVADWKTHTILHREPLGIEAYSCILGPAGSKLYISLWGAKEVGVFDVASYKMEKRIATGSHPNDMTLSPDGKRLFVACANDNTVSIIDLAQAKTVETLSAGPYPDAPAGSTTNSVALAEDSKTLFVANADNNCLAVFDVEKPGDAASRGFIPTGWYPTAVRVSGSKIYVSNGKGFQSFANPKGPNPNERRSDDTQYIGRLMKGQLSIIDLPNDQLLADYTKMVNANTPFTRELMTNAKSGEKGNPVPQKLGDASPIKHVFYIIKENRTYDQVFGDLPQGNGDPSLVLFGDSVTPNIHALAKEFVLLDNFYVNAEVSADGHNWSMGAYANDFVEKTWPTSYGGRGGNYDYEGGRDIAYPDAGFIWDACARAGRSFRTYGEFAEHGIPSIKTLVGKVATTFPGYDLEIRDTTRFELFRHDFDSLLKAKAVPAFSLLKFGNDHTYGPAAGRLTPAAMVADNDLAVGKFVEMISHSPIWKESLIIILEDDAQNGPDHVDAHRSPCLVISPYIKRHQVVSEFYTTCSALRTLELVLGIKPMSQFDAAAHSMWKCFQATPDYTPFTALRNRISMDAKNPEKSALAERTRHFNYAVPDAIPDLEFSELIWKTVKGEDSKMPSPVRSAFVWIQAEE